jgi:hypothetical protein
MMASTVWTLALTTPFSPMTSLPPTFISPPTSHSTWIESAMSNLPSMRARSPTTESRGIAGAAGCPFSDAGSESGFWAPFWLLNIGKLLTL